MNDPRAPRDERLSEDPRDPRDERRSGDPRDPRDPRTLNDTADKSLEWAVRSYQRIRWLVLGAIAAVLLMAATAGGVVIYHQQQQLVLLRAGLEASCNFFTDLAGLPVTPVPPLVRPSQVSVSIVADSRVAAFGRNCPGVPPPSPSLKKWAAYYHIPLR